LLVIITALGLSGLLIPLAFLLFLLQILLWASGSSVHFSGLLRILAARIAPPLHPLKGATDALMLALLCWAGSFFYGMQTSSPEWIIGAGFFSVLFAHIGDKLLLKDPAAAMNTPVKARWIYFSHS